MDISCRRGSHDGAPASKALSRRLDRVFEAAQAGARGADQHGHVAGRVLVLPHLVMGERNLLPGKHFAHAGINAPVGLVLIGDGRERARVARAAADNPHIQLLSPISDRLELARLFASADALIHGCEAETFCMVASEARASGLPLIAPDGGGAADQARLAGGWTYVSGDAASAAEAISAFVETGGAQARARAVADAPGVRTMEAHFDDLFALYKDLIRPTRMAA